MSPRCREGDAVCPAWLCGVGEPRRSSWCRGFSSPFELVVGEEEQREFSVSSSRVARPQIPLPALLQPPALPPQLRGLPWPRCALGKEPSSEVLASCPAAEPSGGASPARGGSLGHVAPSGTWRARFWGRSVLAMLLWHHVIPLPTLVWWVKTQAGGCPHTSHGSCLSPGHWGTTWDPEGQPGTPRDRPHCGELPTKPRISPTPGPFGRSSPVPRLWPALGWGLVAESRHQTPQGHPWETKKPHRDTFGKGNSPDEGCNPTKPGCQTQPRSQAVPLCSRGRWQAAGLPQRPHCPPIVPVCSFVAGPG